MFSMTKNRYFAEFSMVICAGATVKTVGTRSQRHFYVAVDDDSEDTARTANQEGCLP